MANPGYIDNGQLERIIALLADATTVRDSLNTNTDGVLITDAIKGRVPTATITASQARNGPWWAYVSLAPGLMPKKPDSWVFQETGKSHYWFDRSGATEEEATRKALRDFIAMEL
jgi:hypothetical protein